MRVDRQAGFRPKPHTLFRKTLIRNGAVALDLMKNPVDTPLSLELSGVSRTCRIFERSRRQSAALFGQTGQRKLPPR